VLNRDARSGELVKVSTLLCARSIKPLAGKEGIAALDAREIAAARREEGRSGWGKKSIYSEQSGQQRC
jgi:hypothetical protein